MNDDTLLLRQVHPAFMPKGVLSSQAFLPFPKDNGGLSVYDGDQVSPLEAYRHYTVKQGLQSEGVWAVSGAEVRAEGLDYRPDPVEGNPAHALIDFGKRTEKQSRKLAKQLKILAELRGRLYPTE